MTPFCDLPGDILSATKQAQSFALELGRAVSVLIARNQRPGLPAYVRRQSYGALGWPLVPSTAFPGETTLACPRCASTNVTLTSVGAGLGSGPGGRHRMGDNYRSANICNKCGYLTVSKEVSVCR